MTWKLAMKHLLNQPYGVNAFRQKIWRISLSKVYRWLHRALLVLCCKQCHPVSITMSDWLKGSLNQRAVQTHRKDQEELLYQETITPSRLLLYNGGFLICLVMRGTRKFEWGGIVTPLILFSTLAIFAFFDASTGLFLKRMGYSLKHYSRLN